MSFDDFGRDGFTERNHFSEVDDVLRHSIFAELIIFCERFNERFHF